MSYYYYVLYYLLCIIGETKSSKMKKNWFEYWIGSQNHKLLQHILKLIEYGLQENESTSEARQQVWALIFKVVGGRLHGHGSGLATKVMNAGNEFGQILSKFFLPT